MLSVDTSSPDPSPCSFNVSAKIADDSDPEKLAAKEADLVNPGHSFSIRDYVLTSRSKNIRVNWPFSDKFLQLCWKHGVRDVLPPFEPSAVVRAQSSLIAVAEPNNQAISVALVEEIDSVKKKDASLLDSEGNGTVSHKPIEPLGSHSLGSSKPIQSPASKEKSVHRSLVSLRAKDSGVEETTTSVVTTDDQIGCSSNLLKKNRHPHTKTETKTVKTVEASVVLSEKIRSSSEPSEQRRRLIVKFAGEEIVPNSSTATEPMASKVCPVCKIFASTSNTTLNAHIDQCLAMESTAGREVAGVSKPFKVKPRKMRSMVDICATAPHCTLEELERRNGLSCAVGQSLPAGEGGCIESKRPRPDFCDDGSEVYVDSNGTKVRILSRFNDAPAAMAEGQGAKPRKLGKVNKSVPLVKRQLGLHGYKAHQNGKLHSKKLRRLKLHRTETRKPSEGEHHEENEESLFQLLKARDMVETAGACRPLKKWACWKRSTPLRKNNDLVPPDLLNDSSRLSSGSSAAEISHLQGNWRLQDRSTVAHSDTGGSHGGADDGEENTAEFCRSDMLPPSEGLSMCDCSKLKFVSPSVIRVSSPRSLVPESNAKDGSNTLSPKAKGISSLKNVFGKKSSRPMDLKNLHEMDGSPPAKKCRKLRYVVVRGEQERQLLANKSTKLVSLRRGYSKGNKKLCGLKNVARTEVKESIREAPEIRNESALSVDEELPSPESRNQSSHGRYSEDMSCYADRYECNSLAKRIPLSEEDTCELAGRNVIDGNQDSENKQATCGTDMRNNSCESMDERATGISENEDCDPASFTSYVDQEVHCSDVSTVVSSQTTEVNARIEGDCLQTECADVEEPELCLPSYEEMGYQVFLGNSSVNGSNPQTMQEQQLFNSQSASPGSVTSIDSTWQPARSVSPPAVQGEPNLLDRADLIETGHMNGGHTVPSSSILSPDESSKIDRENLRITIPPSNYLVKFPNEQPCCCSRKESAPRTYQGSHNMRQNFTSLVPLKGKQMISNLNNNRMDHFNSFGSLSASQIDNHMLESSMCRLKCADASGHISSAGDFDMSSPSSQTHSQSAPSPVLRLMGKNLMVMNEEKDVPVQECKGSSPTGHPNSNYLKLLGFSAGSFNGQPPNVQDLCTLPPNTRAGFHNTSRNFESSKIHQSSVSAQKLRPQRFLGPSSPHGTSVKPDLLVQQKILDKNSSFPVGLSYDMRKIDQCLRPNAVDHITGPAREVIIIDDPPEVEVDRCGTCGLVGARSHQPVLGGMLLHTTTANCNYHHHHHPPYPSYLVSANCNYVPAKSFSCFPSNTFLKEPLGENKPNFLMSSPGPNGNHGKRGNYSKDGGALPDSPLILSSAGFPNPSLYYSSSQM